MECLWFESTHRLHENRSIYSFQALQDLGNLTEICWHVVLSCRPQFTSILPFVIPSSSLISLGLRLCSFPLHNSPAAKQIP